MADGDYGAGTMPMVIADVAVSDLVVKGLVFLGAVLLVVGPALQAKVELEQYDDLAKASGLTEVARLYGRMFKQGFGFPFLIVAQLRTVFKLIRATIGVLKWLTKETKARPARQRRITDALRRARNWVIVMYGAVIILVASGIDLGMAIHGFVSGH